MITYITINMSEIALVDFNQVLETSEQKLDYQLMVYKQY